MPIPAALLLALMLTAPARSAPTPPTGCTVAADCQLTQNPALECRKRTAASAVRPSDSAVCRCDFPTGLCRFAWEGPVACSADADCSWGRDDQRELALPARFILHPPRQSRRRGSCEDHIHASCDQQARVCRLNIPAC